MTTVDNSELETETAAEGWIEWAQEISLDLAMLGTALGLAWYSTLQIWTYI